MVRRGIRSALLMALRARRVASGTNGSGGGSDLHPGRATDWTTYQTVPPPTGSAGPRERDEDHREHDGRDALAAFRASPLKRPITARTAATNGEGAAEISPDEQRDQALSTRPASANQNAAHAVGLERRSTEEDIRRFAPAAPGRVWTVRGVTSMKFSVRYDVLL